MILNLACCFSIPRYRVFRKRSCFLVERNAAAVEQQTHKHEFQCVSCPANGKGALQHLAETPHPLKEVHTVLIGIGGDCRQPEDQRGKRRPHRGSAAKVILPQGLVPRLGQLHRCFGVGGGEPAGHCLNPLPVVKAAHIRHIHNAGVVGKTTAGGGVDVRRFHLCKARLYISEHEHDFGNTLIGGKAEDSGAGVQYVNLACTQVVRQSAVVPGEVGLIDHLVGKRLIVAAGDDFAQRHLRGKLIAPIEGVKGNVGAVLDL